MSNVLAGIGRGQMEVIDDRVREKRDIHSLYRDSLEKYPGVSFLQEPDENYFSNMWLTTIIIDPDKAGVTRETIQEELEKLNIETRPLWKPMHLQPVFAHYAKYLNGTSEYLFKYGLCLPSGSNMDNETKKIIVEALRRLLGR